MVWADHWPLPAFPPGAGARRGGRVAARPGGEHRYIGGDRRLWQDDRPHRAGCSHYDRGAPPSRDFRAALRPVASSYVVAISSCLLVCPFNKVPLPGDRIVIELLICGAPSL